SRRIGVSRWPRSTQRSCATAMASLEQRSWSCPGAGNTDSESRSRDGLALAMGKHYLLASGTGIDAMQQSAIALQQFRPHICGSREPIRALLQQHPHHVIIPVRLNKLLSAWRSRKALRSPRRFPRRAKRLSLALQGGGAHGAFTWGVIDQLLADGRIAIEGISGTSAGAVNAVMLADGLAHGGSEEARRRLADFWRAASLGGNPPELQRALGQRLFSPVPPPPSPVPWFGDFSRLLSPYHLNPLNINPLRDLIERYVDFERLRRGERRLYIAATNVMTGEPRVFSRGEITPEAVMASACLPLVF